MTKWRQ